MCVRAIPIADSYYSLLFNIMCVVFVLVTTDHSIACSDAKTRPLTFDLGIQNLVVAILTNAWEDAQSEGTADKNW